MNPETIIQDAREKFGRRGLERVEECLLILGGRKSPHYLHPDQEATRLFFPGIAARPWHDVDTFPWAREVEARWKDVLAEFQQLQNQKVAFYPYQDQYTGDLGWHGWNTWHLYRKGVPTDAAKNQCPKTLECLALSAKGLREGLFSILKPGTHLQPHTGGANLVLTAHLPLIVPDGCALRVADDTRAWREGKLFIFDDSFIHEAWNRGESQRVVLLWDVWHPDLTSLEIEVLTYLFPMMEAYLTAH